MNKLGLKLLLMTLFVVAVSITFGSKKAAAFALNPNPRPNGIPSYNATMLENCNFQSVDKSPAFQSWLSDQYAWATQTITVPYGTTSVPLSNHWASSICSVPVAVPASQAKTLSATVISGDGAVNGAAGKELILANGSSVGDYRHAWYNFTYDSAPLTTSKTITIRFEHVGINYITDGRGHTCIGGNEKPNLGGWFYDQCQSISYTLTININVVQTDKPPTGEVKGNCDALNGDAGLLGWAIDPDSPVVNGTTPHPIRILVYKDRPFDFSVPDISVTANEQTGGDTGNLFGIDGNYAFRLNISQYNDAKVHNFYIYAIGIDQYGNENGIYRQIYGSASSANPPSPGNPPSVSVGPCAPPDCSALQIYVSGTDIEINQPEVGRSFDVVLGSGYNPGGQGNQTVQVTARLAATAGISGTPQVVTANIPPGTNLKATNLSGAAVGIYTLNWTLEWNDGVQNQSRSCNGEVAIARLPYLRIYGNDIHAGGVVSDSNACSIGEVANPKASIFALTDEKNYPAVTGNNPPPDDFSGAATQFAAFALGEIDGFMSNGMHSPRRTSVAASPVYGLTFGNYYPPKSIANTGADWDVSNTILDTAKVAGYGGKGNSVRCIPDYFSKAPSTIQNRSGINISAAISGDGAAHVVANGSFGRMTIAGDTINGKKALYVEGDVVINGDISLADFSSTNNISSFYLVVKGNIYIRNNIGRLDGVYIAQDDGSGAKGRIYTCTKTINESNIFYNNNQLESSCNGKLTVNGAFIAEQIKFLRTNGTVGQGAPNETADSGNIAEVFNFSPETYIGGADNSLIRGGTTRSYDYITSLPPIL